MKHLDIASTQIGVQEIPKSSNAGPDVEKYLKSIGLGPGYSWCMAFCYWCFKTAYDVTTLVKTGGVLRQWNEVDPKCKFKKPAVGDIGIIDHGKGLGHAVLIRSLDPDGLSVHTIEGNSNSMGSREGQEVCELKRPISKFKGFIRPV